jgi:hypothetical protein
MPRSYRSDSYAFVLWGEAFREIPATIFVGELRRAGIRVKIVGLNGQRATGAYGLKLVSDISLDQALGLVERANCIIVPGDYEQLQQFSYDPRLNTLLKKARLNNAPIFVGRPPSRPYPPQEETEGHAGEFIEFPDAGGLFEFVERTANSLLHAG